MATIHSKRRHTCSDKHRPYTVTLLRLPQLMTTIYSHLVFPKSWHVIISYFIHGHAYMTHISEMPGPLFKKILPTGVTGSQELEECFHLIAHVLRAQHPDEELRVREVAEGVHVADRETPRLTCVLASLLHFNIVSMFFSSKFFSSKLYMKVVSKAPCLTWVHTILLFSLVTQLGGPYSLWGVLISTSSEKLKE